MGRRSDPDDDFQETHRNQSRQWILDDGRKKGEPGSVMKKDYIPRNRCDAPKGSKRTMLYNKYMKEMREQILRERAEPPPIEEYCTTYEVQHGKKIPAEDGEQIKALCVKYPLYASPQVTFWRHRLHESTSEATGLQGATPVPTPDHPFRKNAAFSKPIGEVLDDPLGLY